MNEQSDYVAELQRHIRSVDRSADCALRLASIEAELRAMSGEVERITDTLALMLEALSQRPKLNGGGAAHDAAEASDAA
jgi:hypothetical protein